MQFLAELLACLLLPTRVIGAQSRERAVQWWKLKQRLCGSARLSGRAFQVGGSKSKGLETGVSLAWDTVSCPH